jgi:tripartite-type tricarboxylate transporter receptor subunit TctC
LTYFSTPSFTLAEIANDFYANKTITIYVGFTAGGGYDQNARLVARFLGKYIAGSPNVIVRNMPGGGGLVMTNYVANAAPQDGLHIGAPQRGVAIEPLLGDSSHAKFDPVKLNWIGSTNSDTSISYVSSRTGIKTWRDILNREVIVGATGDDTESATVPTLLRNLVGLKFKVISGYPGSNEIAMAVERGEIEGRGTTTWTTLKPHYNELITSGKNIILFQMGLRVHPDLPDVPLILNLTDDPERRRLLEIEFSSFEIGRPEFVAEQVPSDRVFTLRHAFDMAMQDNQLKQEAILQGLDINPVQGEEINKLLARIYNTPPEVISKLSYFSKKIH